MNVHVRRSRLEWLVFTLVTLLIIVVAVQYELLEHLVAWSHQYEDYELDEIFTALIVMPFMLIPMMLRRQTELRQQVRSRQVAEKEAQHLALHDPLTGLPNRNLFTARLNHEFKRAQRDGKQFTLLALDLDLFKRINDTYGHLVGDELLVTVAERLLGSVRSVDTVARLGGDEFAIILTEQNDPERAAQIASRIVAGLADQMELGGHTLTSGVSIGIAISDNTSNAEELLRAADVALYRAKSSGRSTHCFFDPEMDVLLQRRQSIESGLRQAMAADELELHFQPLYQIPERNLNGFEALLRWHSATLGSVPPDEFIVVAEEIGLIHTIGDWVLEQACSQAVQWPTHLGVAVNISPVQFKKPDLPHRIASILARTGLSAARLELEITESVLIQDTDNVLAMLNELRTLGVRVAMDDFGTGYSSLSYLRKFPFDKIKIDRTFIKELQGKDDDDAVIRAVVAIGRSMGITTLAEGVENELQLNYLQKIGCNAAQGYLLGRPMPAAAAAGFIPDQAP